MATYARPMSDHQGQSPALGPVGQLLSDAPKDAHCLIDMTGLCNAFEGQAFQPDPANLDSINLGKPGQPRKADLPMRCEAVQHQQITKNERGK